MIPTLALSDEDVVILRAACLDGAAARAAVETLRRRIDIDALDWGRQRLLSLLHDNLVRLGIDDWHDARLRGVRRYFWARSEMRLRALRPALTALVAAGIEVVLLKGAALVASGTVDLAARPMDDLDVLVREDALVPAIETLAGVGFHPRDSTRDQLMREIVPKLPGALFTDRTGAELDVHWHVLHADGRPGTDDGFWGAARDTSFLGAPARVLDPADQLLHTIAHAVRWSETSSPRWAADALGILRAEGALDWDRLAAAARRHRVVPAVADALELLHRHLGVAVPDHVRRRLSRPHPVTRFAMMLESTDPDAMRPWQADALTLLERRRTDARLWRRPLPFTAWRIASEQPDLPRAAARFAFRAAGEPRRLRPLLRIDRWARSLPEGLPMLDLSGEVPDAAFLEGWHGRDGDGRWSSAREARIGLRLPAALPGDLRCDLRLVLLTREGLGPAKARIFANDTLVATRRSTLGRPLPAQQSFAIPAAALRGRRHLVLAFTVEQTVNLAARRLGRDRRTLGLFVAALTLRAAASAAPLRDGGVSPI